MLKLLSAALITVLLLACSGPERRLVPGQTTMSELIRVLGQPSMLWSERDGALLVEFARASEGGSNFVARVGRDGIMQNIQEMLTDARVADLKLGMTRDEVRRQLGQPHRIANTEIAEVWYWPLDILRPPRWQVEAHFGAGGKLILVDRTPMAPGIARRAPAGHKFPAPL